MRTWLALSVAVLSAGCVSTTVQRVDLAARPPRPVESVAVLLEPPQRSYTVIAVLDSKSDAVFRGFDDLRRAMVAKAAELGGDAVVLGPTSTESSFVFTANAMIQSDRKKLTGEVIVFLPGA